MNFNSVVCPDCHTKYKGLLDFWVHDDRDSVASAAPSTQPFEYKWLHQQLLVIERKILGRENKLGIYWGLTEAPILAECFLVTFA